MKLAPSNGTYLPTLLFPPTPDQGWEEKEEGRNLDGNSHSKHKTKGRQVSIIKEKHSRYIPPPLLIRGGRKKKRGEGMETAIQNSSFSSHPLIRGGMGKRRGEKG